MLRVTCIVVLAVFAGQATGAWALFDREACAEPCPGEHSGGDCPPTCQSCNCCPAVRPVLIPPALAVRAPALSFALPSAYHLTPPSPEPREILHVPKLGHG
ncbi:MAG: hypothetical protein HY903_09160 [Deltaproteobacteria bacterium]|nr:hypothetical protein [Deltaproteobacteria bacterium]